MRRTGANHNDGQPGLRHRQVDVEGISIHVVECGTAGKPTVVFLHGWPQNWAAFAQVMFALQNDTHTIAIDLPGIGGSWPAPHSNDKRTLAKYVLGVIAVLELRDVTLGGTTSED